MDNIILNLVFDTVKYPFKPNTLWLSFGEKNIKNINYICSQSAENNMYFFGSIEYDKNVKLSNNAITIFRDIHDTLDELLTDQTDNISLLYLVNQNYNNTEFILEKVKNRMSYESILILSNDNDESLKALDEYKKRYLVNYETIGTVDNNKVLLIHNIICDISLDKHFYKNVILLEKIPERSQSVIRLLKEFPDLNIFNAVDGDFLFFVTDIQDKRQEDQKDFFIFYNNKVYKHNKNMLGRKMGYNEAACALSHVLSIVKYFETSDKPYLLQLEDDAVCKDPLLFRKIIKNLPENFDLCQLYTDCGGETINKINDHYYHSGQNGLNRTSSFILSRAGALKMLDFFKNDISFPSDDFLSYLTRNGLINTIYPFQKVWDINHEKSTIENQTKNKDVIWDRILTYKPVIYMDITYYLGIGNQMFRYAALKTLAIEKKCDLIIKPSFKCHLTEFPYIKQNQKFAFEFPENIKKYTEKSLDFDNDIYNIDFSKGNILIDGFFQDFEYFKKYESLFKCIFNFDNKLINRSKVWRDSIPGKVIGVHMRLPDFKTDNIDEFLYAIPTINFFNYSFEKFGNSCTYVVFSNNNNWSKDILSGLNNFNQYKIHYIDEGIYQDMCNLSFCNSFIVSPSTFSWWSIFLSKNKNIKVISSYPFFSKNGGKYHLNNQIKGLYNSTWNYYDIYNNKNINYNQIIQQKF